MRTPVKENYIPRLLAGQTKRKVGLVKLDQVLAGVGAIREALEDQREEKCQVIVLMRPLLKMLRILQKHVLTLRGMW